MKGWIAVAFGCLAGLATPAANAQVLARYVLVAHSPIESRTVYLARAILAQPATACPAVTFSDGSSSVAMQPRVNPNPAAFGVTVCEAVVEARPGATATLAGDNQPLPLPAGPPGTLRRLVVVGDSGCKAGTSQPCGDAPESDGQAGDAWPFPEITAAAAAAKPDLVIHVGDYNYRGTPNKTDEGQWSYDGCLPQDGSPLVRQSTYDTWHTWNADFFTAARPLLEAAPWVFVRGNHELCSRAGQGWFYFLDPHSPILDPYQAQPGCNAPTALTEPYRLSFNNLDLVVLDNANACGGEDPESPSGIAYEVEQFRRQLVTLDGLLAGSRKPTWLLGHRPLWSLYQEGDSLPGTENRTLQAALAATPSQELSPAIRMLLSGHMHQFQSLTFQPQEGQAPRPPQLVIGNSGVALAGNDLPAEFASTLNGRPVAGLSINTGNAYGYLLAEIDDEGNWKGTVLAFDATGEAQAQPVAECGLPLVDRRLCRVPAQ